MTTAFTFHEWLSAAEIAELALPGMPVTKRKVNERAAIEAWAARTNATGHPLARKRRDVGGGLEYHVSLLPQAALLALRKGTAANDTSTGPATVSTAADPWGWFRRQGALTQSKAARALKIVQAVETLVAVGVGTTIAVTEIAEKWGVGASTIYAWMASIEGVPVSDRLPHLAPRHGGGRAQAEIDDGAWRFIKSDYLRPEKPSWATCYSRLVEDYATPRGLTVPHSMTLRRKLERELGKVYIKAMRYGMEAARRSIPPQKRSVLDLHALEAVNIDGHTFDVFVRWEDGTIGRPVMVGIQDIYSRKLLAHRIGETECTLLTRLAFADLFGNYGIPRKCVLDNGRAFASKAITGGAKTRFRFKIKDTDHNGVLTQLGIDARWTLPYRGSSKPIERAWGELCERIAKHPTIKGAYTGNKPDAKPENYGSQAIPIEEFRAHVACEIAKHNARPSRDTEAANGRSFDEAFAASYAVSPVGKASEDAMLMALLLADDRTCDREHGAISFHGNRYWTEELHEYAGKKVTIRFDPDNLHSPVHVYTPGGVYICAAPAIEATGFFDQAGARHRAKLESDLRKRIKQASQAENLLQTDDFKRLMVEPRSPTPTPSPTVMRAVRNRGHAAASLKPIQQTAEQPAEPAFIDNFLAGTARLRVVGE